MADLAAENSRYVDDDDLAKVARIAALELKGTAYLRLCRLEQADADAGEARLPSAALEALSKAVEAFEAPADVKRRTATPWRGSARRSKLELLLNEKIV